MSDRQFSIACYMIILVISGIGEYIHLLPMGTMSFILGAIIGHGTANGLLKINGKKATTIDQNQPTI